MSRFSVAARDGFLFGCVAGALEVILYFGSGTAPFREALGVFCGTVLLWTTATLGLATALRLAVPRSETTGLRRALLLLAPLLLLAVRGTVAPTGLRQVDGVYHALVWSAALVVLLSARARHVGGSIEFRDLSFLAASVLVQGISGLAFVLRELWLTPPDFADLDRVLARLLPVLGACLAYALILLTLAVVCQTSMARATLAASLTAALVAAGVWQAPDRLAAVVASRQPAASRQARKLVLIVLDTVRRDRLSAYGYARETTPRLDQFASSAAVFSNAYTTAPESLAAHASLFTGLLPGDHGAHGLSFDEGPASDRLPGLPLRFVTLAESLRERGYRTAAISANPSRVGRELGLLQGFDAVLDTPPRLPRVAPLVFSVVSHLSSTLARELSYDLRPSLRPADQVTTAALEWVGTTDAPYFLFLNYFDTHAPYEAPPEYRQRFLPKDGWSMPADLTHAARVSAQEAASASALYDGCLRFVDEHVGRLLAGLEELGGLEDMLIVVTSDHGELLGERGLLGHARTLYEPVLAVPLVVKLPGQRHGCRVERRVTLGDLPDMIRAALDGRLDCGALARAGSPEPRVVAEHWTPLFIHELDPIRFAARAERAIYDGPLKLIERTSPQQSELYDLARDPGERNDLLVSEPAWAQSVKRRLTAGLLPVGVSRVAPAPAAQPSRELLRSLGYVR